MKRKKKFYEILRTLMKQSEFNNFECVISSDRKNLLYFQYVTFTVSQAREINCDIIN